MDYRDKFDYREQIAAPVKTWKVREFNYHNPAIKPLFYEGPEYEGRPTRVFAWVGLPENASRKHPVPGVVLVHGGGGTALANWVEVWNKLGYAAISMDTCGGVPCWDTSLSHRSQWPRHKHSGPAGWGDFKSIDKPFCDQWMYHAAAAVIRGANLLCSLPEVDASKVGITGISWGGYLTNIVVELDDRFKFAVPVYGCSYCDNPESGLGASLEPEKRDKWFSTWDPCGGLEHIKTPMLFLNDAEDFAFTLNSWQRTVDSIKAPVYSSMRINYVHAHSTCYDSRTIPVFARAMLEGEQLPQFSRTEEKDGGYSTVVDMKGRKIAKCTLAATRATGCFVDRKWRDYPAECTDGTTVHAPALANASTVFFIVEDEAGCQWSSPVLFLK